MRRAVIIVVSAAFILAGVGGYFAVTTVMAALSEVARAFAVFSATVVLPAFAVIALLLAGADWFSCIELIRRVIVLLGLL